MFHILGAKAFFRGVMAVLMDWLGGHNRSQNTRLFVRPFGLMCGMPPAAQVRRLVAIQQHLSPWMASPAAERSLDVARSSALPTLALLMELNEGEAAFGGSLGATSCEAIER